MNALIFLALSSIFPTAASASEGEVIYRANCFVYDLAQLPKGQKGFAAVALKSGEHVMVGSYQGLSYEVTALENTGDGAVRPDRQLILTARKAPGRPTDQLIGSSNISFSIEVPSFVAYQAGENIQFYCMAQ